MKNTKIEFRFFTIPQWRQEQDYLRQQHNKGWAFTKVDFIGLYHFEKCEAQDVVYQLDYNQEGIANKVEYVQMFRDCGWEYLQDYVGYSYFRKASSEMNGNEEIFCDDTSRLEMMKKVFKGRMIPLIVIFFTIIIPQLLVHSNLKGSLSNGLTLIFIILGFVYLILFTSFGIQFWKYWKSLN
ncbi:DUF2812 domain-containing protein [Anaerosacchariphilus polymeriproducens]|uniref:DUF2812 domain-containing protein n=1 Tax=Anaerosacchariphilus polymeriproducens TaxID=1812858 RepID=A0A371AXD8_9FIRM|nr:DUF2812 domain-containing protein [Anaerosacchariphilus polymeriproducens]RDU24244.1 DUF2812 domain-containing protein [Anaerosacchariphilus polymeriproducens]